IISIPLLAVVGFAAYFYWSTQQFEVTGQVLYRNPIGVGPARGARVEVYNAKQKPHSGATRYSLLLLRQMDLHMSPDNYPRPQNQESQFTPLKLAPLGAMNWTWWEVERLNSCFYAAQVFRETLQKPEAIATTSTDMDGRYWLNL